MCNTRGTIDKPFSTFEEAVRARSDLRPRALDYSDPIVYARDLQAWTLREKARRDRNMNPTFAGTGGADIDPSDAATMRKHAMRYMESQSDVKMSEMMYNAFMTPTEGENR